MATNFPSSLDAFTNPTSGDTLDSPDHAGQHADANDAIEALQAKVGVDGSAVSTSHDYILANGVLPKLAVDTDTLFVDATNDRVGIGDTSPSYTLDVNGDINATGALRIGGTAIGTWTAYTPILKNITVGNGTVDFRYCQINNLVALYGRFTLGSTSAVTAGFYFTMPTGLASASAPLWQGSGFMRVGGTNYVGLSARRTQSTGYCLLANTSGIYGTWGLPSNTVPAPWTTGDYWVVSFVYEVS